MGKLSMFQWLNLTKTMESSELPQAPETLRHGKVKLVFHRITEGDKEKGFIPGYHFIPLLELSKILHLLGKFFGFEHFHVRFCFLQLSSKKFCSLFYLS